MTIIPFRRRPAEPDRTPARAPDIAAAIDKELARPDLSPESRQLLEQLKDEARAPKLPSA